MNPGLNPSRSTVLTPVPPMEESHAGARHPIPWSAGGNAIAALQSSAARNFAWLATDKVVATLLGLLVFGMIARHYGPVGSGHYAYALTLLQAALGLSLVCSTAAILPRLSRMSRGVSGALANVFVVRLLGSVVAASVVALYALLAIGEPDRLVIALMVVAAVPLVEPFFVATLYWQSRNDNRLPVLNRGVGLLVRTTVVAAAVAFGAPLWVPAVGWILEMVVVAVLQVRSMGGLGRWSGLAARVSVWRASRYFRYGVRFLLGIALGQLFLRGDRLVLAAADAGARVRHLCDRHATGRRLAPGRPDHRRLHRSGVPLRGTARRPAAARPLAHGAGTRGARPVRPRDGRVARPTGHRPHFRCAVRRAVIRTSSRVRLSRYSPSSTCSSTSASP